MTPKAFLKLQREWYGRLKQDGFNDIEEIHRGEVKLKVYECLKWRSQSSTADPERIRIAAEYYLLASEFLNEWGALFMSEPERIIWEMHAEGYGVREISALLIKNGYCINKDTAAQVIRDLKTSMFVVMNVA